MRLHCGALTNNLLALTSHWLNLEKVHFLLCLKCVLSNIQSAWTELLRLYFVLLTEIRCWVIFLDPQWILSLSHCHQQVEIWCRGGHTSHLSSLLLLFPFYLTYHMMFETAVIMVKAKMWRQANQIAASVHINSTLYFSKVPQSGRMMQNIRFILNSLGLKILRVLRLSITL